MAEGPLKKLVIGSDHGGFGLKIELIEYLGSKGVEVLDVGCPDTLRVDYPDIAAAVTSKITSGEFGETSDCCCYMLTSIIQTGASSFVVVVLAFRSLRIK